MKSINKIFTAAALVTFASFANAQTEVPNTFEAGAAATAASVNANFDALITAIDSLGTRVTSLESGATSSGNVTIDDLVDKTYCVSFFGNIGGINANEDFARIGSYVGSARLVITSPTTASLTNQLDKEFELGWFLGFVDPNQVLDTSLQVGDYVDGPTISGEAPDGVGPFAATIDSFTGGVLTVSFGAGLDSDTESFTISPDGNMLLGTNFDTESDGDSEAETNLIVGMSCI